MEQQNNQNTNTNQNANEGGNNNQQQQQNNQNSNQQQQVTIEQLGQQLQEFKDLFVKGNDGKKSFDAEKFQSDFMKLAETILTKVDSNEKFFKDLEEKAKKDELSKTLDSSFSELTKGMKLNSADIKKMIGFENITSEEQLKERVELIKNTLITNGNPHYKGVGDSNAGIKGISDQINKNYKLEPKK